VREATPPHRTEANHLQGPVSRVIATKGPRRRSSPLAVAVFTGRPTARCAGSSYARAASCVRPRRGPNRLIVATITMAAMAAVGVRSGSLARTRTSLEHCAPALSAASADPTCRRVNLREFGCWGKILGNRSWATGPSCSLVRPASSVSWRGSRTRTRPSDRPRCPRADDRRRSWDSQVFGQVWASPEVTQCRFGRGATA
jgi:hypothetical protein